MLEVGVGVWDLWVATGQAPGALLLMAECTVRLAVTQAHDKKEGAPHLRPEEPAARETRGLAAGKHSNRTMTAPKASLRFIQARTPS